MVFGLQVAFEVDRFAQSDATINPRNQSLLSFSRHMFYPQLSNPNLKYKTPLNIILFPPFLENSDPTFPSSRILRHLIYVNKPLFA